MTEGAPGMADMEACGREYTFTDGGAILMSRCFYHRQTLPSLFHPSSLSPEHLGHILVNPYTSQLAG